MKNKTLRIIILTIILVLFVQLTSFAALGKLTLKVKTNKDTYKVGDKVTVTIDWTKEVESAGFVLKYDKSKLTFDSTSLGSNFYNAETDGKILFNWAAFDGKAITKVTFVFTTKAEGNGKISVEDARGFADEGLNKATDYDYKSKTIKISNVGGDVTEKPDTDDKEDNTNPSNPSIDNNKNEVIPDKPSTNEEENKVISNNNTTEGDKDNETTIGNIADNDNYNEVEKDDIPKKEKKQLTSSEVKIRLIIVLIISILLLILINGKRK